MPETMKTLLNIMFVVMALGACAVAVLFCLQYIKIIRMRRTPAGKALLERLRNSPGNMSIFTIWNQENMQREFLREHEQFMQESTRDAQGFMQEQLDFTNKQNEDSNPPGF